MRTTTTILIAAGVAAGLVVAPSQAWADDAGPTGGGTTPPTGRVAVRAPLSTQLRWEQQTVRAPARRVLPVEPVGQKRSDYCGPASGRMIAAAWGRRHSRKSGNRLSQRRMSLHMHFREYGYVPYWSGYFADGINRWLFGHRRGHYSQHDFYGASGRYRQRTFRRALVANVSHGHPIAVSTVEWKSMPGQRYNGHPAYPSDDIGHWIVARGYQQRGRKVVINDPAWTIFSGSSPTFTTRSRRMARVFADNGIVA